MSGQSLLLVLLLYAVATAPWCPLFAKAGKRWWVALLPVINVLVIMRIAARPWWWALLLLIPVVGIGVWTVVCLDVSERFGHGVPFTIGLVFLPFFFALWLGLGPDVYSRTLVATETVAPAEPVAPAELEMAAETAEPAVDAPVPPVPQTPGQTIGAGE